MDNRQLLLRGLPKIDELLLDEQLVFFMESTPRSVVVDAAREIIDELRREILSGEREDTPEKDELIAEICDRITGKKKRNLRTLINATGVVLHTTWAAPICAGLQWKALRLWLILIPIWNTT